MPRVTRWLLLSLVLPLAAGCPKTGELRAVDEAADYRARITRVRHAIDETRSLLVDARQATWEPELTMRLGELISEEARYHYLVAFERQEGRGESLHLPQVRLLKEQAIAVFRRLVTRFPDAVLSGPALFDIAQEQRELGMFDEMKATLEELVQGHGDSPYRTEALLSLGDHHFDRGELDEAGRYYQLIIDAGPGPFVPISHYKLGWVAYNNGDCEHTVERFEAALRASAPDQRVARAPLAPAKQAWFAGEFAIPTAPVLQTTGQNYEALRVEREALIDVTFCYAQVRPPDEATAYLRKWATRRDDYVAALSKMARRFLLVEQPAGAAPVIRELLSLAADDPERLDDARLLHRVVVRLEDYTRVGEDVGAILQAMRRRRLQPAVLEAERAQLALEFSALTRDLALRANRLVLAAEPPPEDALIPPVEQVIAAYEAWLSTFPGDPATLEVLLNVADTLREGERFLDAGDRYRQAAAEALQPAPEPPAPAEGEDAAPGDGHRVIDRPAARVDALYDAAVAYQRAMEGGHGSARTRALARAGLRVTGAAFLASEPTEADRIRRVTFAVASSYHDEGDHLRAVDLLTAVALQHPGTEQGDAAVLLALDAHNSLNDLSGLIRTGQRFMTPDSGVSPATLARIGPIVESAEQRRLDELTLSASGDEPGDLDRLLAFADRYEDSDLGERALLGTFVAARAGGDASLLFKVGAQVLERFPGSEQAPGVAATMGQVAVARYQLDEAVEMLSAAARANVDPGQRAALHLGVGELLEQLGDATGAERAYREAIGVASDPNTATEGVDRIASLVERTQSATQRVVSLGGLPSDNPEVASRLGLAMISKGDLMDAESLLYEVVGSPAGPGALARAHYGIAETMLSGLEGFEGYPSIDAIDELAGLVEITVQSYLEAARQPDPMYGLAALARLARASEVGAAKMASMPLPPGLSAEESLLVREALAARSKQLTEGRRQALEQCALRAAASLRVDAVGQACLGGKTPLRDPVAFPRMVARTAADVPGLDGDRDRLAAQPDDTAALRAVGMAYLAAGDPHVARVALARLSVAGPTPADLFALGDAAKGAGDLPSAVEAWARAAELGGDDASSQLGQRLTDAGLGAFIEALVPTAEEAP